MLLVMRLHLWVSIWQRHTDEVWGRLKRVTSWEVREKSVNRGLTWAGLPTQEKECVCVCIRGESERDCMCKCAYVCISFSLCVCVCVCVCWMGLPVWWPGRCWRWSRWWWPESGPGWSCWWWPRLLCSWGWLAWRGRCYSQPPPVHHTPSAGQRAIIRTHMEIA